MVAPDSSLALGSVESAGGSFRATESDEAQVNAQSQPAQSQPDGGAVKRIRILIADDHAILREGTRKVLDAEPDFEVVAEAADGEQAVELAKAVRPDILLLDIGMPRLNGIQVADQVHQSAPETRVIVLTGYDNEQYAEALVRFGIRGYLTKGVSARELANAIRTIHAGQMCFESSFAEVLFRPRSARPVTGEEPTARELEVLCLVAEGQRNREIAKRLLTSERTVEFHLNKLFSKLHASSRTEMVYLARQKGWLT